MMESPTTYNEWIGATAYDSEGDKLGEIENLYYDDASGRPEWVEVKTGMLSGTRLVPINGATADPDGLRLPFDEERIKTAPEVEFADDGHLSADQEQRLYEHYGLQWSNWGENDYGYGTDYSSRERFDRDYTSTALPTRMPSEGTTEMGDEVVQEITTTTQRPKIETEDVQSKVRLRKYRWTETETVEVPVTHEEVRMEVEGDTRA